MPAIEPDVLNHMVEKGKYATYGNLLASGGQIVLLITALQVLGDHGTELEGIRGDARNREAQKHTYQAQAKLEVQKIQGMLDKMDLRMKELERELNLMVADPHGRPDAWTRTDDIQKMYTYDEKIKRWVREYHDKEHGDSNGR